MSPFVSRSFAVSERCCAIIILIILISKYEECEKKKPSSISTKETILHLYTRNSHFCIAFVKKMINVICVLVFCSSMFYYFRFICGHQFYCRQNIDYVQTRDNQGIATYIFTVSVPFVFAFLFIINFPSFKARLRVLFYVSLYLRVVVALRENSGKNPMLLLKFKMNLNNLKIEKM